MQLQRGEKSKGPECAACGKPADGGGHLGTWLCQEHRTEWFIAAEPLEQEWHARRTRAVAEWSKAWAAEKRAKARAA
jgi:hypothetical protein